ncbi:MAG: RNA polymerase sigma factor [Candidatus Muirbacterium halophilum]|nr:RNA polymerase sigma factor [Candidatus Muirbacterium halophilum]MCK9476709.1 RNA polymerase sigma factor [Candidatus Muirbacterium halophilum]
MDENEIKKLALNDPEFAFEKIFELYHTRMFYFCLHITGNREESMDITQDVFLKAYFQEGIFSADFNIRSWLYKVSKNECRKFFRIVKKTFKIIEIFKNNYEEYMFPENLKDYEKINKQLDAIPEKHRTILFLRFYENLSYEEISEILEIPLGTVMSRISRAKEVFRRFYEQEN